MKHLTRPEYSLTPEAQELARILVEAWDNKQISSYTKVFMDTGGLYAGSIGSGPTFTFPSHGSLGELQILSAEGLVQYKEKGKTKYGLDDIELILLPQLRIAVESNFEKPDNVTGFNINGNVGSINSNSTISNQQNVGMNYGVVNMTSQEIADKLIEMLGQNLIDSHEELRLAIKALRSSNEDEKPTRLKRIATTLTNMLGIGADIATVAPALVFLIALL